MAEETTKGRGYIYVSVSIWEHLGKPETLEAWHKALMLPDMYEVGGVYRADERFEIIVLHELIPLETKEHPTTPVVHPYYGIDYVDGVRSEPYLTRVEIRQWNGEHWQTVAVTDEVLKVGKKL